MKVINKDLFIEKLAERGNFTKSDMRIILDEMIKLFEDIVADGDEVSIRGLGRLYTSVIPSRKGKDGQQLPKAKRIIFRLSENPPHAEGFWL